MSEQSRKSFETHHGIKESQREGNSYKMLFDRITWNAWQASKACEQARIMEMLESKVWHEAQDSEFDTGFNEAKRQAIEAIKQRINQGE